MNAKNALFALSALLLSAAAHATPAVNAEAEAEYVEPSHRHGALRMAPENRHAWNMERAAKKAAAQARTTAEVKSKKQEINA